jgi:DNA polymerase III subunit alpha
MFVHLHVHSDNSILNGVIKVEKIVKKAHEYGMPAVALTDNGSMYPTYSFYSKCKGEGVKPIYGCQVALAARTRFDKEAKKDEKTSELVLLAKNKVGYHNLIKIVSKGHLEGFYYRARVDRDLLREYKDGITCLSGGENGEIFKNFLLGNNEQAKQIALDFKEIWGDDFYLEIQRTGVHAQEIVNPKIIELSQETGIPLVATNNVYYEKEEDAEAREVLWAIDSGRLMSDPARRKPESNQEYFKTPEEMEKLFADLPQAIENTVKIAEKVEDIEIGFGKVQPVYPNIPAGETEESFLRKLVFEKGPDRFGYWTPELIDRLEYELKVIHDKGYDGYFLVMWSIVNWAREQGIMVSTRGSAAGAAISFAIGITTLDPVKWKLFFERFLNPERKSLPDIDLDISDNRRDEVIEWCKKTYGYDNVCNVGALGKLTTRAGIRDVSRVLGIDLKIADKLSKLVPVKFGRVTSISACISDALAGKEMKVIDENREAVNEFRRILKTEDGETEVSELVDTKYCPECFTVSWDNTKTECKKCHNELKVAFQASAKFTKLVFYVSKIEGCIRNISTHACGHLITPGPVTDYCPVQVETGSGKRIITMMEGKYLEEIGLMKFDFLGLANLSIIDNAVKFIKEFKHVDVDIFELPQDDKKSFELLQRGDTTAVFQLESSGMRKYLKELHPETIEEISSMCALYRPGPIQFIPAFINRKFKREETNYLIPEIVDIMEISYGLPVYQEQVLQIANRIAGYSLGEADNLRRAIGKKLPEVMAQEEKKFKEGVVKNTKYDEKIADELWKYAQPFADYGFNKAHSAAYAYIAYITAYLKSNYPTEFAAALMLSDIDNQEKLVRDILDAEARDIKLLHPDINKSDAYFRIEEEGIIRFGIGGLKGVGMKPINALVDERKKNGEYTSLDDLCARIDHKLVTKGAIESLIKIGAFDSFGKRSALLQVFTDIYERAQKLNSTTASGFVDIFASDDDKQPISVTKLPDIEDIDDLQKIQWEKEMLGVALTPSLLQKITPYSQSKKYPLIASIAEMEENANVKLFGQLTSKREILTKKGDKMCFGELSDVSGRVSVTFFPRTYADLCETLLQGDYLLMTGKTQKRNDEMQVLVNKVKIMKEEEVKEIWIKWSSSKRNKKKLDAYEEEKEQKAKKKEQDKKVPSSVEIEGTVLTIQESPITETVSESGSPYSSSGNTQEKIPLQATDKIMNKIIEIYIKKDALIDELKKLNEYFQKNVSQEEENSYEVYLHLPNHETLRKIKLEGKYNDSLKNLREGIIEKINF